VRKLLAGAVVLALAAAGSGVAAATTKKKSPTKVVSVRDDYYRPGSLKMKPGTTVKWVWDKNDLNEHSVVDEKGGFQSTEKLAGTFRHRFKKAGTWHIFCSVHPETMRMTIKVKK
jgi:plastocyanin